jgi:ABC-type Na+ efflux pump permease subunit
MAGSLFPARPLHLAKPQEDSMLQDPLFIIVALAVLVVAGILLYGIGGFAVGSDGKKANTVMQLRIIAQLIAVILILGFVWLRRGG